MLYLLEHAKARWQVWLLLSPGYLICAVFTVIFGITAVHDYETGATTAAPIDVAVTAMLAATTVYFLRIVVRRAAAMLPRPGDAAPPLRRRAHHLVLGRRPGRPTYSAPSRRFLPQERPCRYLSVISGWASFVGRAPSTLLRAQ